MENKFNLVDEPWIPVAGKGLVSLDEIFSNPKLSAVGGNPVQKIALTKLFLAIAQTAYTPKDEDEWKSVGVAGMTKNVLAYLADNKDLFWLYGEKPFLQMPALTKLIDDRKNVELKTAKTSGKKNEAEETAMPKYIGSGDVPDLPSENNKVLTQNQGCYVMTDAEKAVFIITLMNFAPGGKRVEKDLVPLSTGYEGKGGSAKPGPSIGNYHGYLHSFLRANTVSETLWLNVLTHEQINEHRIWTNKLGIAPWEKMPMGESCDVAVILKSSYMGCLVALSRFVLLKDDGIYYVEGIQYPSHKEGWREPTMAIKNSQDGVKLLWVNPGKRPWRELTALLSFIASQDAQGFDCQQIHWTLQRAKKLNNFIVWSGGLKVRGTAGDQSVKQDDDYVESEIQISKDMMEKGFWFPTLMKEMDELQNLSKITWSTTKGFYKEQKADGKVQATQSSDLFWQLCERKFQSLVDACDEVSGEKLKALRKVFAGFVDKAYNTYCPNDTARQLDAWAAHKPDLSKYLFNKEG